MSKVQESAYSKAQWSGLTELFDTGDTRDWYDISNALKGDSGRSRVVADLKGELEACDKRLQALRQQQPAEQKEAKKKRKGKGAETILDDLPDEAKNARREPGFDLGLLYTREVAKTRAFHVALAEARRATLESEIKTIQSMRNPGQLVHLTDEENRTLTRIDDARDKESVNRVLVRGSRSSFAELVRLALETKAWTDETIVKYVTSIGLALDNLALERMTLMRSFGSAPSAQDNQQLSNIEITMAAYNMLKVVSTERLTLGLPKPAAS